MKQYVLKDEDFEHLKEQLLRDWSRGRGGSSGVVSEHDQAVANHVHRFFTYVIHTWIDKVTK